MSVDGHANRDAVCKKLCRIHGERGPIRFATLNHDEPVPREWDIDPCTLGADCRNGGMIFYDSDSDSGRSTPSTDPPPYCEAMLLPSYDEAVRDDPPSYEEIMAMTEEERQDGLH